MNESNLFQEIDEDLQRKQMEEWWKRHGNLVIGGAVAIVLATAAYTGWQTHTTRKEQKATASVINVLDDKKADTAKKVEALEQFAKANIGIPQAFIARFHAASELLKDNQTEKALEIYNALAADASVETPFRQLADLFAVQIQLDSGDTAALQAKLDPLLADSAWKWSAKEMSAYLALRIGDKARAKKLFEELSQEVGVPASIVQRAGDMKRWLGEEVKADEKK